MVAWVQVLRLLVLLCEGGREGDMSGVALKLAGMQHWINLAQVLHRYSIHSLHIRHMNAFHAPSVQSHILCGSFTTHTSLDKLTPHVCGCV